MLNGDGSSKSAISRIVRDMRSLMENMPDHTGYQKFIDQGMK
jgi:hypothetical protein